ncbi:MAG: ferrous iron transport protein A [Firmicutes bacterium]|nr:ferrous iron transport protein A [Bacillota bacterium]
MPLTMMTRGIEAIVKGCRAKDKTKKFLEGLGLVPGTKIAVVAEMKGDLIISVKGSRLAINKGIAQKLDVEAA